VDLSQTCIKLLRQVCDNAPQIEAVNFEHNSSYCPRGQVLFRRCLGPVVQQRQPYTR